MTSFKTLCHILYQNNYILHSLGPCLNSTLSLECPISIYSLSNSIAGDPSFSLAFPKFYLFCSEARSSLNVLQVLHNCFNKIPFNKIYAYIMYIFICIYIYMYIYICIYIYVYLYCPIDTCILWISTTLTFDRFSNIFLLFGK